MVAVTAASLRDQIGGLACNTPVTWGTYSHNRAHDRLCLPRFVPFRRLRKGANCDRAIQSRCGLIANESALRNWGGNIMYCSFSCFSLSIICFFFSFLCFGAGFCTKTSSVSWLTARFSRRHLMGGRPMSTTVALEHSSLFAGLLKMPRAISWLSLTSVSFSLTR